jgi:hypothetical protein
MISRQQDDFTELRETLRAMTISSPYPDLGRVFEQLLDLGYIGPVDPTSRPAVYAVQGIRSRAEVDHLIADVENDVDVALLILAIEGAVCFTPSVGPLGPDLEFTIIEELFQFISPETLSRRSRLPS